MSESLPPEKGANDRAFGVACWTLGGLAFVLLLMVGASRALGWFWLAGRPENATHRLLIYGAGNAGAQTAAAMQNMRQYRLMGFVDDDHKKADSTINGVRVYSPHHLPELIGRLKVTDVLLAIPSTTRQRRHQIIASLQPLPVHIRTLPGLADWSAEVAA